MTLRLLTCILSLLSVGCLTGGQQVFGQSSVVGKWIKLGEKEFVYGMERYRDSAYFGSNHIYSFDDFNNFSYTGGKLSEPLKGAPFDYSGIWTVIDTTLYMKNLSYNGHLLADTWGGTGTYPDWPLTDAIHCNTIIKLTSDSLVFAKTFECSVNTYYFGKLADP